MTTPPFAATWDSLAGMEVPAWFRDGKFGIFLHWGVQSVPANDGWYARHMYMQEGAQWGDAYRYHCEHFGHPSTFGYKDLVPLWTAERWDPDGLARSFRSWGARYLVYVAAHHDNFDNYDSRHQDWNSLRMGPRRDVTGEWAAASRRAGLRFGVSSHIDRTWSYMEPCRGADVTGPLAGVPYDGNLGASDGAGKWWEGLDPADLYGPPHEPGEAPSAGYVTGWERRTVDLVERYRPDLLYFDSPLPFGERGLAVASHFYNASASWHGGVPEAVLNVKSYGEGTVPDERAVVLDIEKGQSDRLRELPWQTDTSLVEHWFHTPGPLSLSAPVVIHNLCDIVSKNGNLLLNVGLRADGTLPGDQETVLREVGAWLEVNGEAVYGTRPWTVHGEGPTRVEPGDFHENTTPMTARDIRFTTRAGTLYAIFLGWPEGSRLTLGLLGRLAGAGRVGRARLVGSPGDLTIEEHPDGLDVLLPERRPCEHAYAVALTGLLD